MSRIISILIAVPLSAMAMFLGARGGAVSSQDDVFDPNRTFAKVGVYSRNTTINIFVYPGNYTIDWGDGTVDSSGTQQRSHTYSNAGVYKLEPSYSGDGTVKAISVTADNANSNAGLVELNFGNSVTGIVVVGTGMTNHSAKAIRGMDNVVSIGSIYISTLRSFKFPPLMTSDVKCTTINSKDLETLDFNNVTSFSGGTQTAIISTKLKSVDLSRFTRQTQMNALPKFANCTALETVNYGAIGGLGYQQFMGCRSLRSFTYTGKLFAAVGLSSATSVFQGCENLYPLPFDTSTDQSVDDEGKKFSSGLFGGNPNVTAATVAMDMFAATTYQGCSNLVELAFVRGGRTPSSTSLTVTNVRYNPNLRKIVLNDNISFVTFRFYDSTNSIEELVFNYRYTANRIRSVFAEYNTFAKPFSLKFPYNTMAEVMAIKPTASTGFPFGAPANWPASKIKFVCSDGTIDAGGNVVTE